MTKDKDTIYVDIDDEITTIIDKVRSSEGKVVALVLPKRAAVFQSIVNMKLLKRAVESAKKHLVLITSEANLMPLAGAVGLHVAATPQSKPEIPAAAEPVADEESMDEPVEEPEFTADNAGDQPVGELSKRSGHVIGGVAAADTAVTLDDEVADDSMNPLGKLKKNRHLKVPNFNKFRLRLFLAILGLIALIVGLYIANVVLPKATIAITTNSSNVNVSLAPTLDTAAQKFDGTKLVLPAKSEQQQKTSSQQVDATGQKNTGDVASGSVDMSATACAPNLGTPNTVPAGTGITTNGLTFITQKKASFSFDHFQGGSCAVYKANNIDISAQNAGTKYNVSGATFSVAGRSDVSATGSASGGTDNIIKVVSQADIDGAKQKLTAQDTTAIQAALEQALRDDGMYPLVATFKAGDPVVTTTKNVGDEADNVTVTEAITYTMFGTKKTDLDALIQQFVDTQIDPKKQSILNNGLSTATITITNATATTMTINLQTVATVGPDLNVASIKQQAANKKIGDVKSMINAIPGVTDVEVQLSPFWVSTVPSNAQQVTVSIDKGR